MAQKLVTAISPETTYTPSAGPRAVPRTSTLATASVPTQALSGINPSTAAILAQVFK